MPSKSREAVAGEAPQGSDEEWASRAEWCGSQSQSAAPKARASKAGRSGLILTGHGMRLRINGGALEIQNGFTHYPEKPEKWRFFRGDPKLPTRIIVLDGSGAVTLDVFGWLSEQDIPLIQVDFRGRVVAAIGANCLGVDPGLLERQVTAAKCPTQSLGIATWLIREKLVASRGVIERLAPVSQTREVALARLDAEIDRLGQPWVGTKVSLLGIEGKCAEVYFAVWREMPLAWSGTSRRPVPDRWRVVGPRGSRKDRSNRGAIHPVQAMLNYGYAVLESQVRLETARVGLDAATGFLHQQQPDRAALILDLIEPLRPLIDDAVMRFTLTQSFTATDFTLDNKGVCRLHPQLARRLVLEIGEIGGLCVLQKTLFMKLGHQVPAALPHRSRTWLTQRKLELSQNSSVL